MVQNEFKVLNRSIINIKFKQGWWTIPTISTNEQSPLIPTQLNIQMATTYDVGNPVPVLEQKIKCGRIITINGELDACGYDLINTLSSDVIQRL